VWWGYCSVVAVLVVSTRRSLASTSALYYRPPLDIDALHDLARDVAGPKASVTGPGEWGRGLTAAAGCSSEGPRWTGSTATATASSSRGRTPKQAGTTSISRSGIRSECRTSCMPVSSPLASSWPTRRVRSQRCRRQHRRYPPLLWDALVAGLWEASFDIDIARKAVTRGDTAYVAGCLFRVVEVSAQALHGHAEHWLINEKDAVASAGLLSEAPRQLRRAGPGRLGSPRRHPRRAEQRDRLGLRSLGRRDQRLQSFPLTDRPAATSLAMDVVLRSC
jgi:hypothetical protein